MDDSALPAKKERFELNPEALPQLQPRGNLTFLDVNKFNPGATEPLISLNDGQLQGLGQKPYSKNDKLVSFTLPDKKESLQVTSALLRLMSSPLPDLDKLFPFQSMGGEVGKILEGSWIEITYFPTVFNWEGRSAVILYGVIYSSSPVIITDMRSLVPTYKKVKIVHGPWKNTVINVDDSMVMDKDCAASVLAAIAGSPAVGGSYLRFFPVVTPTILDARDE